MVALERYIYYQISCWPIV